ncbi:MAG: alcohol dehydrogenase catalytic domain-containing protein [Firmicutes bacterium]|nr:alcohol dehydrogenase catalytic domain-containing protein [Bacillota bacterium]
MKAAVLRNFSEPLSIEDVPVPKVQDNEILVKVKACGMCGTDIKIWKGYKEVKELPLIMGHEPSGEIVELGDGVKDFKIGDRGIAHFYLCCGHCLFCKTNRETLCSNIRGRLGFELDGGFTEYIVIPAQNFIPIPDELSFEDACIIPDAISTTYHALSKVPVSDADNVLIMGLGGLGLHALQLAKAMGANVIGVDISEEKLDFARGLGFENLVLYDQNQARYKDSILQITNGADISIVLETVSSSETINSNLELLGKSGKVILNGYRPDPVDIPIYTFVLKELSMYGSRASCRSDVLEVIKLITDGRLKPVVSKKYRLEEINCALEDLFRGKNIGRQVISFE